MVSSAIDFEWYRSFVAVYREGTVTRAAEARGLTQPAVSQHLAALEGIVGRPLFRRLPRWMEPTEAGEEMYTRIAPATDLLERASSGLPALGDRPEVIRLGGPGEFLTERLLPGLAASAFRWRFRFDDPVRLLADLEAREIDLAVVTQRVPSKGMDWTPLIEETFLPYGRDRPPSGVPDPAPAAEAWLLTQPWIAYAGDLPLIRRFWRHAFGHRPPIDPVFVLPDLRAVRMAIEAGLGASVLPTYLADDAARTGRVTVLWRPPHPVTNQLWLVSRRADRTNLRVVEAVAEAMAASGV